MTSTILTACLLLVTAQPREAQLIEVRVGVVAFADNLIDAAIDKGYRDSVHSSDCEGHEG